MKFIDVSEHNSSINWNEVKASGIDSVIIKATEGATYRDRYIDNHYTGAKAAGLKVGFYHYLRKSSDPGAQVSNFLNTIYGKSWDIKPVLDVEEMLNNWMPGEAQQFSELFIRKAKENGLELLIYSGRCFIEENFSPNFCSDKYWWVAEYNSKPGNVPKCGTWTAWQYTETGNVSGVNGNCDVNVIYEPENFFTNYSPIGREETPQENIYTTLQTLLNDAGFRDRNGNLLAVDGIPGELTLSACPLLKEGCQGSITQWVQLRVGASPDGSYGVNTKKAVIYYQESKGLLQDGIVGPITWRALLNI